MEDLNEKQIKKLRILDNKLNESERDDENLKVDLEDLSDFNIWDLEISIEELFPDISTESDRDWVSEVKEKRDFENSEIDMNDLQWFEHKCPKCGFEFNSSEEE